MTKEEILQDYKRFLEDLVRTESSQIFTNGGKEYASILMSVLLKNTKQKARIYCEGFRPELIMTEPYLSALKDFIDNRHHDLDVLVKTDAYKNDTPLQLLKKKQDEGHHIRVRVISADAQRELSEQYVLGNANFAAFDGNMFRLEMNPQLFRAFGSFNHPAHAGTIRDIFDHAFENSKDLEWD